MGPARTLALELGDSSDAVVRVLATLRRRRCEVTRVYFVAPERHQPVRLVIGIRPPPAHAHCVETWLGNLVDVISVESV